MHSVGNKRLGTFDAPELKRSRSDFLPQTLSSEDLVFPRNRPDWDSLSVEQKRNLLQRYISCLKYLQTSIPSVQDPTSMTPVAQPSYASYQSSPYTPAHKTRAPKSTSRSTTKKKSPAARQKRTPVPPKSYIPIPIPDSHPRPGGQRPSTDSIMKSCLTIVDTLVADPSGGQLFSAPVDPNTCGAPDYYDRVINPMDLGTVRNRLHNGYYRSIEEFADDCRQTFENSLTFNPKDHPVHNIALYLKNRFEDMLKAVVPAPTSVSLPHPISSPQPQQTKPVESKPVEVPLPGTPMPATQPPVQPPTQAPVEPQTPLPATQPAEPAKPKPVGMRQLTFEEKRDLKEYLGDLDDSEPVIEIVERYINADNEDEEIEIDFDSMSVECLWELFLFAEESKRKQAEKAQSDYE
ncbi:hypothetical protein GEMRC1_011761 [Eukaryota sp. GEM-RC1]